MCTIQTINVCYSGGFACLLLPSFVKKGKALRVEKRRDNKDCVEGGVREKKIRIFNPCFGRSRPIQLRVYFSKIKRRNF